tara:strand:+ start:11489 stop:12256 length:768 start_codon:yes stop_codon:yes gene_type:complete
MCNVFIPEVKVVRPRAVSDLTYQAADLEAGRFNYTGAESNLEGDYPQSIGGLNANKGSPIAYADIGPVPSGPGYDKLKAILENAILGDWAERGNPGNPNILATYEACGLSYRSDGSSMANAWCAAFVSWALKTAGIESLRSMGSQTYRTYGSEVDWRTLDKIRYLDIVVFKSRKRSGGHIGFVVGADPSTNKIKVLGGNQGNDVKISTYSVSNTSQYIVNIKRNWDIPAEFDKPLFGKNKLVVNATSTGTESTTT